MLNRMSTLAEIEAAVDALPSKEKQELLLFLMSRIKASGARVPPTRDFSKEEIERWIAEDEAEMQRFREGK